VSPRHRTRLQHFDNPVSDNLLHGFLVVVRSVLGVGLDGRTLPRDFLFANSSFHNSKVISSKLACKKYLRENERELFYFPNSAKARLTESLA
jgi:hypothetical protein